MTEVNQGDGMKLTDEEIRDLRLVLEAADAWEDEYINDEIREAIVRLRARLAREDDRRV